MAGTGLDAALVDDGDGGGGVLAEVGSEDWLLHPPSRTAVPTTATAARRRRAGGGEAPAPVGMPEATNGKVVPEATSEPLGLPNHNSRAGRKPVNTDQVRDRLAGVLTEPLAAAGLDVEAIELTPAGRRRLLRVAVDKDGGVTLDDIADATKEVSRVLDGSDVMGEQPYTLEVTSPGTDRPLTHPRHWRRNRGRLVKVSLADGRSVTGRIAQSDGSRAVLDVEGTVEEVGYGDVTKAKVQLEFNRKEP